MKIHRVVTMLGATTETGKLASDMYDLNYRHTIQNERVEIYPYHTWTFNTWLEHLLSYVSKKRC